MRVIGSCVIVNFTLSFTETEVDLCSAFDVQGLVKCFHVFGYNTVDDNLPFHCRFVPFLAGKYFQNKKCTCK